LILVPTENYAQYLRTTGINCPLEVLSAGVNASRFVVTDPIEKGVFYHYFRLSPAKKFVLVVGDYGDLDMLSQLETIAQETPTLEFYFLGLSNFGALPISYLKRLNTKAPANLHLSGLTDDDIYRSGLFNATAYLSFSNNRPDNLTALEAKSVNLAAQNKDKEVKLAQVEKDMQALVEVLPEYAGSRFVGGGKENNHPIYHFGKEPTFDGFKPKDHVELEESLGLIDYKRGVKISAPAAGCTPVSAPSSSGLCSITSSLSTLPMAIPSFFRRTCSTKKAAIPPGQFPKFKNDVFWVDGTNPKKFMLPTAETALVNIYRNEILSIDDLPKKFFAYTPCYRNESLSYHADERGMVRGYQFNKVEMVQYTTDDGSDVAFRRTRQESPEAR
jgi:hypothetical protein